MRLLVLVEALLRYLLLIDILQSSGSKYSISVKEACINVQEEVFFVGQYSL